MADQISELTTNRLSVYLRCLNELDEAGVRTVSSKAMADRFQLNAAQIRKDLAYFGEFGVRGVGYYVTELKRHLRLILGLDREVRVAIIGAGNLGLALADYPGFRREGFSIVALFDSQAGKIGQRSRGGIPIHDIRDLKRFVRRHRVGIVVVAVPARSAQSVVNRAVAAGVRAVLNFSPGPIRVPEDVKLKSVDLTVSMESLSYHLADHGGAAHRGKEGGAEEAERRTEGVLRGEDNGEENTADARGRRRATPHGRRQRQADDTP